MAVSCTLFTICEMLLWNAWSECSTSCGSGQHTRSRELCCYPKTRTSGSRCLLVNCNVAEEDYHDYKDCIGLPECPPPVESTDQNQISNTGISTKTTDSYSTSEHLESLSALNMNSTLGTSGITVTDDGPSISFTPGMFTFTTDSPWFLDDFIPQEYSMNCSQTIATENEVRQQVGECISAGDAFLQYIITDGRLSDLLSSNEFIAEMYRLPPETRDDTCNDVMNVTHIISVIFYEEVPPWCQFHEFNLGIVTSELKSFSETYCPVITDLEVLVDPFSIFTNSSNMKNSTQLNTYGLILSSFCIPLLNTCNVSLSNDNMTIDIVIVLGNAEYVGYNENISFSQTADRIYIYYYGILQALYINMTCNEEPPRYQHSSCSDHFGLVTSTVEAKSLNTSDGSWTLTVEDRFRGMEKGKIIFQSKLFETDGFNLFAIPPEPIKFDLIFSNFEELLSDSYMVLIIIICLLITLVFLTIFTIRYDQIDASLDVFHRLKNSPRAFNYGISLQTGLFSSRNFTSPLFIELQGLHKSSNVKLLNYCIDGIVNIRNGRTTYFKFSNQQYLGPIREIRIWHEDENTSIYIEKIILEDYTTNASNVFLVKEWLSITKGFRLHTSCKPSDECLRHGDVLYPALLQLKMFDDLLLISIFVRPSYSRFTRIQRLYCLSAIVAMTMMTSAMWYTTYKEKASYGVYIGPLYINYKQIYTGVTSSLISIPPLMLIMVCFRKYKREKRMKYELNGCQRKRKFELHGYFCVLAWILTLGILLISTFIVFMYSLQWGGNTSNEWLMALLFGVIFDTISCTLKVALICVFLIWIDKESTRIKLSTLPKLRIAAESVNLGRLPISEWPGQKSEKDDLIKEKSQRLDRLLFKKCRKLLQSILYIVVLIILASHNNPNTAFQQNDQLLKNFYTEQIQDIHQLQEYLRLTVLPFLSGRNTKLAGDSVDQYLIADRTSVLIGLTRIRQHRAKKKQLCVDVDNYKLFEFICDNNLQEAEETDSFCKGWMPLPLHCDSHPWFQYTADSGSSLTYTKGEFDSYNNGGYTIDINVFKSNVSNTAEEMKELEWLDEKTRFISVETTILNPGSRLFSTIQLAWEFTSFGLISQRHSITSTKLYPYIDALDYLILILQLLFIVVTLIKILVFLHDIWHIRRALSVVLKCLYKALSICLSIITIAIYIVRIDRTIYTVEKTFNNRDKFMSFGLLVSLDDIYRICLGLLFFVHSTALLRHLTFNFQLYLMYSTIFHSLSNIVSCIALVGLAIIAFASLEYLYIGRMVFEYRTMYDAMSSLVTATISLAKLSSGSGQEYSTLDNIIFILFCLIVNFIFVNLLVSVLNDTMAMIKSGSHQGKTITKFDEDLSKHAGHRIKQLFAFCRKGSSRDYDREDTISSLPETHIMQLRTVSAFCSAVEKEYHAGQETLKIVNAYKFTYLKTKYS